MTTPIAGGASDGGSDTLGAMLGVAGVVLAVAAMLFRSALPYEIDSLLGLMLLLCSCAGLIWLIARGTRWRRQRRRPRGFRRAASVTVISGLLLMMTAMQVEETGVRTAHCKFGVHGLGYGMVWAKVEPRDPGEEYRLTVRWAGWVGQPAPVVLHKTTYFTFLKRDIYSSDSTDVIVDHDARITCGDGARRPTRIRSISSATTGRATSLRRGRRAPILRVVDIRHGRVDHGAPVS